MREGPGPGEIFLNKELKGTTSGRQTADRGRALEHEASPWACLSWGLGFPLHLLSR